MAIKLEGISPSEFKGNHGNMKTGPHSKKQSLITMTDNEVDILTFIDPDTVLDTLEDKYKITGWMGLEPKNNGQQNLRPSR